MIDNKIVDVLLDIKQKCDDSIFSDRKKINNRLKNLLVSSAKYDIRKGKWDYNQLVVFCSKNVLCIQILSTKQHSARVMWYGVSVGA